MINIELTMWPNGHESHKYPLGRIVIGNTGTGTQTRGNYEVTVYSTTGRVIRRGKVDNWPRKAKSRMELLIAALKACGYES